MPKTKIKSSAWESVFASAFVRMVFDQIEGWYGPLDAGQLNTITSDASKIADQAHARLYEDEVCDVLRLCFSPSPRGR